MAIFAVDTAKCFPSCHVEVDLNVETMGLGKPLPLMLQLFVATAVRAESIVIKTECRVGNRLWSSCSVAVHEPGSRWQVDMGRERWSFIHNGSGTIQIQQEGKGWQKVVPRWDSAGALCWGPICTKGPLPMD
jgi:hypothetical protein